MSAKMNHAMLSFAYMGTMLVSTPRNRPAKTPPPEPAPNLRKGG